MAKMFDGYNTRFDYKGANFLVQTQDKGLGAHYVESLIYKSGKLLTSKKTFYTSFLNSPNLKKMIARRRIKARIEVDGGVDAGNAAALVRAGADILVAGNAIFGKGDPVENARGLLRRMREAEG